MVAHVRELVLGLAWPLAAILGGFAAGALAMHQLQVRGLWATRLIVPDPARLWAFSSGPGLAVRAERSAWSMVKAVVLVTASAWTIRAGWTRLPAAERSRRADAGPGGGADRAPPGVGAGRGALGPGTGRLCAALPAVRGDAADRRPRSSEKTSG